MLMRTDPFRELDALAQQIAGTAARPTAMPMDAYRSGEAFLVLFDLPGVAADSIELTVEQNVLTVHATRTRPQPTRWRCWPPSGPTARSAASCSSARPSTPSTSTRTITTAC